MDIYPLPITHLDSFFNDIYKYYSERGYQSYLYLLLGNQVLIFVGFLLYSFLTLCIDWSSSNIIFPTIDTTFSMYHVIVSMIILLYFILSCIGVYNRIPELQTIRSFYNDGLEISDEELLSIEWEVVVERIVQCHRDGKLPSIRREFSRIDVTGCIMRRDNFLIGLLSREIIPEEIYTSLNNSLYRYIFLRPLYLQDGRWNEQFISHVDRLQSKLKYASWIILPFIPILLVGYIIIFILQHIGEIYQRGGLVSPNRWTTLALWKLRRYNELTHQFNDKLGKAEIFIRKYMEDTPSPLLRYCSRIAVFISGSITGTILLLSLNRPTLLLEPYIPTLLIICGSIAVYSREIISRPIGSYNNLMTYRREIQQILNLPNLSTNVKELRLELSQLYRHKILIFIDEIMNIISLSTFLFGLAEDAPTIFHFFSTNITNRHLGNVFSGSLIGYQSSPLLRPMTSPPPIPTSVHMAPRDIISLIPELKLDVQDDSGDILGLSVNTLQNMIYNDNDNENKNHS